MYFASGENKFISFGDCITQSRKCKPRRRNEQKEKKKKKEELYFGTYQSFPYKVMCYSAISYYIYINVVQCTRSALQGLPSRTVIFGSIIT